MPDPLTAQQGQVLKRIAGFELIKKVGQGGMGAVFKARQISLDRIVALKVLPPSIAKNKEFIERFMREARAAGRLNHPHIVQGIDVGLCEKTQLYYFAMEFVDGPTLGLRLKESGVFPEDYVRKVAQQIGEALDYAHQNGIVHRDIKPDNILMNNQGQAKLADLGLAKQMEKREDASLTQAGVAVGTPFYMAPEQIRGQVDEIDIRTDLYCLGSTLFHLVTGQTPYQGATNAMIMAAHLNDKTPLAHQINTNVSEGFSRLLYALMQKDMGRRPTDPKVFLEMLARVDEVGVTTRRAQRGVRSATRPRDSVSGASGDEETAATSHTTLFFVVGLIAVVLVGGGVLFLTLGKKEESPRVAAKPEEPKVVAPPGPVPISAPPPKPVWNASGEFENAQRAVERNPNDLRGAYNLFDRLLAEAQREKADATWIERITAARDKARTTYETQLTQARADLDAKIQEARANGHFDVAFQAIADFPSPDQGTDHDRLKSLAAELRKEAEDKLTLLLEQLKTALTERRLSDAAARLKEAEAVTYQPFVDRIDALRSQLAKAREEQQGKAAEAAQVAADENWRKVLAEFDTAVLEKADVAMLRVILKTARENKTLEPRKEDVALLNEVGAKFIELADRERTILSSLVGQNVTWTLGDKSVSGRVKDVKDGSIALMVKLDKVEMVRKIKISALSEEDQAKLRPPFKPQGPVESLAAALTKLIKGTEDHKAAEQLLAGAGESKLALHYRGMVVTRQEDTGQRVAETAWGEIAKRAEDQNLTEKETKDLLKALADFTKAHGESTFAAEHKQEIATLSDRLSTKEADYVTADRLVLWNLSIGEGDYYYYAYRGTTKADVFLFLKGKVVAHRPEVKVNWRSSTSLSTEVQLPANTAFDRIQIHVTNWTGLGGGFTEIQVFKGDKNLAQGRASNASDSDPNGNFSRATDGEIARDMVSQGWMLPARGKGWIELDFSKPAPKPAEP